MKNLQLISMALCTIFFAGCAWKQLGSLTMISTRNVDGSKQYVLLGKNVEAKARSEGNALQVAVDRAVASRPGGEYMMNLAVFVNGGGGYVKVTGDVWGIPIAQDVAGTVETGLRGDLSIGDKVLVKLPGNNKLTPAVIIGLQSSRAVIQYERIMSKGNKVEMREVDFSRITKVAQ